MAAGQNRNEKGKRYEEDKNSLYIRSIYRR